MIPVRVTEASSTVRASPKSVITKRSTPSLTRILAGFVYEPVTIEPRVLVPRVIREDSRYVSGDAPESDNA